MIDMTCFCCIMIPQLVSSQSYASCLKTYKTNGGIVLLNIRFQNIVPYPPFQEFVKSIHELSISLNDPSFSFESPSPVGMDKQRFTRRPATVMSRKTEVQEEKENIRKEMCSLHPHAISHNLDECQLFIRKPMEERRRYVAENKLCFRCLRTKFHNKKHCRAYIKCKECGSGNHVTAMHIKPRNQDIPQTVQGGECEPFIVDSNCTSICDGFMDALVQKQF